MLLVGRTKGAGKYNISLSTPRALRQNLPCSSPATQHLRLLLRCRLRLRGLLPVAANHDHAEERPHHRRAEEKQDDGYPDGPHAREEEVLEGMVRVDEGLLGLLAGEEKRELLERASLESLVSGTGSVLVVDIP